MKNRKLFWRFSFNINQKNQAELNWSYLRDEIQKMKPVPSESLSDDYKIILIQKTHDEEKILEEKVVHQIVPMGHVAIKESRINGFIPFNVNTTHILLIHKKNEIFRLKVPDNISELKLPYDTLAPKGRIKLKWQYKSESPENTWFRLYLQLDNGKKLPISNIIREPEYEIDFNSLPGCKKGAIMIRMSDGVWTKDYFFSKITIPYKKPRISIFHPREGQKVKSEDFLELKGQAWDEQTQSVIPDEKLTWYIDKKTIGKGNLQLLLSVNPGKHIIGLQATDSVGVKSTSEVTIHSEKGSYLKIVRVKKQAKHDNP